MLCTVVLSTCTRSISTGREPRRFSKFEIADILIANSEEEIQLNMVNDFSLSGATLTLNSQPTAGQIIVINIYPKQFYRLGTVIYSAGALPIQELQRVGSSELYHLLGSNLTKPSTKYPIYTYKNNYIKFYHVIT